LVSGFLQFILGLVYGYQLSFIDIEHYQKISSVSSRLRGFFIEPNWYAIALTFNSIMLLANDPFTFIKKNPFIALATGLAIIFNGSLAPAALLFVVYAYPYIKRSPVKGMVISVMLLIILSSVFTFRDYLSEKNNASSTINYLSRWVPFSRVIDFQADTDFMSIVAGHGLGSWGNVAIGNRLSALVYEEDPGSRDGSEIPVFLFELGIIGIILIIFDTLRCISQAKRQDYHLKGGIVIFFVFLFLYPTLKFWMYMPYYFYLRSSVYEKNK